MFYIHQTTCISPQQTFPQADITVLHQPADRQLKIIEPIYERIPPGILRRMSKSVRIGVGAALPLLSKVPAPDGIIIGTGNAGLEDCFHFLKQIIDYNEGLLSPGSFVQSTPNALAAQLSMLSNNKGYNITHVHMGLAFENALMDAAMLTREHPAHNYLVGAVDDISADNHHLNFLAGWFKDESFSAEALYGLNSPGSIGGEGATMFLVNGDPTQSIATLQAISTLHSGNETLVEQQLQCFLDKNLQAGEKIDLLISGENGDNRLLPYYAACEKMMPEETAVVRFKHMCGEYPTASAVAVWLACYILQHNPIPQHLFKKNSAAASYRTIFIYNNFKGTQHSFVLLKSMSPL